MKAVLIATLALAAALPACTSPAAPAATTAQASSESRICIDPRRIREQKVLSDTEIQFTMTGGDVFVNTMRTRCPGLKMQQGFAWDVRGTSVCSNQQSITVLNEGTTCQLGDFTRAPATPS